MEEVAFFKISCGRGREPTLQFKVALCLAFVGGLVQTIFGKISVIVTLGGGGGGGGGLMAIGSEVKNELNQTKTQ